MKSTGHWNDIELLKRDKAKAYRFLADNGIRLCFDSDKMKLLKLLFTSIFFALRDDIFTSDLSLVYLYQQSEQSGKFAGTDGLCNISAEYGTTSIGISAEALVRSLKDMLERHIDISIQLQKKALEALVRIKSEELSPRDIREFIKLAVELERQSRIYQTSGGEQEHEETTTVDIYIPMKEGDNHE